MLAYYYMGYLEQIFFALALAGFGWLIFQRFQGIVSTIHAAKPIDLSDNSPQRWKNVFLLAFGQKKMFQKPLVAIFHFFIYSGFLLINIEVLEIVLDGLLGTHRLFFPILGSFYSILINFFEVLSLLVVISCIVFLVRRWFLPIDRLKHSDLNGFPKNDALYILYIELVLMFALWKMNAIDAVLQSRGLEHYPRAGTFLISQNLIPFFESYSTGTLIIFERIAWWFHILGILSFALYVTYSKHLHIFFAFPSTYFSNLNSSGKINYMPSVFHEIKIMMGEAQDTGQAPDPNQKFGAKDVLDLTWKNALDAYSCTECGRCTEQCPANASGRLLSPRKIMMATRDRLEQVSANRKENKGEFKEDGKSLLNDFISAEELRACTTCQACVEACPINLNPLDIILQLRRYQIMELSDAPSHWNSMFNNLETSQSPWKFNPSDRFNWSKTDESN